MQIIFFMSLFLYLHLGWTCWTAVLMDCVHWPPGPSHTGLDSKQSLQVTQLLSSHKLSQDATHRHAHKQKKYIQDKWNLLNKKVTVNSEQRSTEMGRPWRVRWECRSPWCSRGPRWAACRWGRGRAEETVCSVCNPARPTAGCCSGWPAWPGEASAERRSLKTEEECSVNNSELLAAQKGCVYYYFKDQ